MVRFASSVARRESPLGNYHHDTNKIPIPKRFFAPGQLLSTLKKLRPSTLSTRAEMALKTASAGQVVFFWH
jgi:hypothetical protein